MKDTSHLQFHSYNGTITFWIPVELSVIISARGFFLWNTVKVLHFDFSCRSYCKIVINYFGLGTILPHLSITSAPPKVIKQGRIIIQTFLLITGVPYKPLLPITWWVINGKKGRFHPPHHWRLTPMNSWATI